MTMVNPNDKQWSDKDRIAAVGSGTGTFVALGFEHFVINGKKCVEVRSVCIQHDTDPGNVGAELRDLFFLHSDAATGRFVKFAKDGCGWTEPFDPEQSGYVAKIVGNRPFRVKVRATQDGQHVRHDCGWDYSAPTLPTDPATEQYELTGPMREAIARAMKAWEGYIKWRAANPRDAAGGSGSGGGGNGGGARGSGGGGGGGGGGGHNYDDIPF